MVPTAKHFPIAYTLLRVNPDYSACMTDGMKLIISFHSFLSREDSCKLWYC